MSELKRVIIFTPQVQKFFKKTTDFYPAISSLTVSFKQYTKSLRQPTTRNRPHATGEENSSPDRVEEASVRPSRPSRTHTVPSVEARPTRVPRLPTAEPSSRQGLEKTFPVVRKLQTREPSLQFRQYKEPSCDPHRTCRWSGVTHGDEKTGPFVRNSHICMETETAFCIVVLIQMKKMTLCVSRYSPVFLCCSGSRCFRPQTRSGHGPWRRLVRRRTGHPCSTTTRPRRFPGTAEPHKCVRGFPTKQSSWPIRMFGLLAGLRQSRRPPSEAT